MSKKVTTTQSKGNKTIAALKTELASAEKIILSIDCVIFGFEENKLKVLLIRSDLEKYAGQWSLLGDLVQPMEDVDAAANRVLLQRTGLTNVYMEQVQAFGKPNRHPAGRVVTVAYYSLLNVNHYKLQKFEHELHWQDANTVENLAFDHQEIFEIALSKLKKRVQEHPLGFNLLPKKFSLRELQNLYESILDVKLDRRNFRKKFTSMDLLIDIGQIETNVAHRPGKLYEFNYLKYQSKKKSWPSIDF